MQKKHLALLAQASLGILMSEMAMIFMFFTGLILGGNYGCFAILEKISNTGGYEACSMFGGILGLILGAALGVSLVRNKDRKAKTYSNIIGFSLTIGVLAPLLLSFFMYYTLPIETAQTINMLDMLSILIPAGIGGLISLFMIAILEQLKKRS